MAFIFAFFLNTFHIWKVEEGFNECIELVCYINLMFAMHSPYAVRSSKVASQLLIWLSARNFFRPNLVETFRAISIHWLVWCLCSVLPVWKCISECVNNCCLHPCVFLQKINSAVICSTEVRVTVILAVWSKESNQALYSSASRAQKNFIQKVFHFL